MMYLINALLFDAQWENTYSDAALKDGKFTTENGQQQNVTMMHSVEDYYLRDELATGMVKYYAAGGYKFVAMLPNEGVSIKDYVASLSGEKIAKMMQESEFAFVKTQLPKFSYDCSYGLKKILSDMGMPLAFAGGADFTDMGTYDGGSLHIGAVIHKTAIEVNKVGTRAAAVTAVQMDDESAAPMDRKNYEITFDRPFVYMIVDRYNLPLFVGVVNSVD
jgi:serpin B